MTRAMPSRDVQCVQVFLPLHVANEQPGQTNEKMAVVRKELTERFGGVSCFLASPVQGRWEDPEGRVQRDELVLFEVMTEALEAEWWAHYRRVLEQRFRQESVLVRAFAVQVL